MKEIRLFAGPEAEGQRVDVYLAGREGLNLTRSRLQKLMADGLCLVGGESVRPGERLSSGDEVVLQVPDPQPVGVEPEEMPLDIVYEDDDVLVLNKQRGLVVHPAVGNWQGTLVHGLLAHLDPAEFAGVGSALRPGIVHRLDKDTTGVMVVAKNDLAYSALSQQIAARKARREYAALVHGCPGADTGIIEAPIGRHPGDRKRMAVDWKHGKDASTEFRVVERFSGYGLLHCRLRTGRTHQIRVHLAYLGHPIVGDPVYGPKRPALGMTAQALHAMKLGFFHPRSGEWLEVCAPLPLDMATVLNRLRGSEVV